MARFLHAAGSPLVGPAMLYDQSPAVRELIKEVTALHAQPLTLKDLTLNTVRRMLVRAHSPLPGTTPLTAYRGKYIDALRQELPSSVIDAIHYEDC